MKAFQAKQTNASTRTTATFMCLLVILLCDLASAQTLPSFKWPPTSGTSLPSAGGGTVTISGVSLFLGTYTLTSPGYAALAPTSVSSTQLVFTFGSASMSAPGTSNMWSLIWQTTGTTQLKFPVYSSPLSIALPYDYGIKLAVYILFDGISCCPSYLFLKRSNQNVVYMELDAPLTVGGTLGQPGVTNIPLPEEFVPMTTQHCFAHMLVAGTPLNIHMDVQSDGYLKFYSSVSGAGWTTSGAIYFNGCEWFAKN